MSHIAVTSQEVKEDRKKGLKAPLFTPGGQSTQMIVGATPTPDKDILITADSLYKRYGLRRVYYSGFSPIPFADARLPNISPPLLREHRLYQADWLLRFYGYDVNEIVTEAHPNLEIDVDPKTTWALRNPTYFPIDVNRAAREQLLRIPGIGVRSVNQILQIRRYQKLKLQDLLKLKIAFNRAKAFMIATDYHPGKKLFQSPGFQQMALPLS